MDKILLIFLLTLVISTLSFIYYFYNYLFKQYEKATLNFYKKSEKLKKSYRTTKKNSQTKPIKNNVTELINQDLINKRVGYAVIEFINEQGRVEKTQIIYKPNFSMGREESNDIIIRNQTISRRQCLITYQNKKFFICNLSATNPTILNGISIQNSHQLSFGDIIEMANYTFRFKDIMNSTYQ